MTNLQNYVTCNITTTLESITIINIVVHPFLFRICRWLDELFEGSRDSYSKMTLRTDVASKKPRRNYNTNVHVRESFENRSKGNTRVRIFSFNDRSSHRCRKDLIRDIFLLHDIAQILTLFRDFDSRIVRFCNDTVICRPLLFLFPLSWRDGDTFDRFFQHVFAGRETMFPVTFPDDISRRVRGSESLCTLVPKRGQSSLNCRITVAETAVKKRV